MQKELQQTKVESHNMEMEAEIGLLNLVLKQTQRRNACVLNEKIRMLLFFKNL